MNQEHYSTIEQEKLKFGIQIFLSEFYKLLVIYLVALLLDCIVPTLIIHLSFFLLRQVCLGYHFNNLYICLICSVLAFPIAAHYIAILDFSFSTFNLYLGILLLVSIIYILAPRGTENQPIINQKHLSYLRQKMTLRLLLLFVAFSFSPLQIKLFIIYGVFLEVIMLIIQTLKGRFLNEKRKYLV